MSDKAIRAAAKEIERHKMEPWTDTKAVEIARDAIAAYEAAMWRPGSEHDGSFDLITGILGWREVDWPERFDRRTAEIMARYFSLRWRSLLPSGGVSAEMLMRAVQAHIARRCLVLDCPEILDGMTEEEVREEMDSMRAALASLGLEVE